MATRLIVNQRVQQVEAAPDTPLRFQASANDQDIAPLATAAGMVVTSVQPDPRERRPGYDDAAGTGVA